MPNTDRENPWSPWVSWHMPGTFAHPDAPAGGTGLGYSREVGPSGTDIHGGRTPDPHSPVGQKVTAWDAAVEYAKFELERARAQLFDARSWETLRIVAEQTLGPKSFGLGACYGIVKNPVMSVAGLLQLMRTLIEADLYERLTQRVTWKTMLKPGGGMGLPKLSDVGYLLAMQSGLLSIADLRKSYETREALIANVEELIKHPIDGVGKMADGIKAEYVEKWKRFRELQTRTDLKSQFEAGEIFGDVLMEVVMVVLTVISVGGAAAKLAAKVPQLARLAEVVKSARATRAGGVAAEGADAAGAAKGAQAAKNVSAAESAVARDWEYAAKQTGRTEPGAVPKTPELATAMKQAEARKAPVAPEGWPQMTDRTATTFGCDPQPVQYAEGQKLYRVIDSDPSASGSFWSTEPPPQTEGAWRGGAAVKDPWNGDGGYVEHTVGPGGLKAWAGSAAPQGAATEGMVLPGGVQQAWVPPNSITPVNPPQPTPWNLTTIK